MFFFFNWQVSLSSASATDQHQPCQHFLKRPPWCRVDAPADRPRGSPPRFLLLTPPPPSSLAMNQSRRSSVSSQDSDGHRSGVRMSKRWTTLETAGRCMFLFSVAFFIVGVLITVFGFTNAGMEPAQQVPLQILGPTCLTMTIVMWVVGCIFSRLWNLEMKRQQHAIELRDRVQLHALAMDILNSPVISPTMLQDPRLRRQLLLKLRAQRALDLRYDTTTVSQQTSKRSSYFDLMLHQCRRRWTNITSILDRRLMFVASHVYHCFMTQASPQT